MTNVLIVEDLDLVLEMLIEAVDGAENYTVVNTAKNADIASSLCSLGNVDLVLMDVLTEYEASGLDAAEEIKRSHPEIKVIIITSIPEASWLERARNIGVDSFWYKRTSKELLSVMDRTMEGESIYPDTTPEVKIGKAYSYDFSRREIDVLRELTTGASNKDIADTLIISEETVRFHIKKILLKTGFQNRTELAVEARKSGFVMKIGK
ncbi:MAG: response regulator transcription factor [Clostridia bacterium]|nr:response regulator transcription factor [Clostridia bacterium]